MSYIQRPKRPQPFLNDGEITPPMIRKTLDKPTEDVSWLHKKKKSEGYQSSSSWGQGAGVSSKWTQRVEPWIPLNDNQADESDATPTTSIELLYCSVLFHKGDGSEANNGFFELINPKKPQSPLRLYRSGIILLCEKLPKAIKQAQLMEESDLTEEMESEIAIINQSKNTRVILSTNVFNGSVSIWLRLFTMNENGDVQPSTYGVRFSLVEHLGKLFEFVANNK